MKLYDMPLSGNCQKVRLLLSLLELEYETVAVDVKAKEHKSAWFLEMNPLGQIPVLVDGALTLRDSQAILLYLALKHGRDAWMPCDPAGAGQVMQWLSFAANEIHHGPATARAIVCFGRDSDLALAQARARAALDILDGHLHRNDWLALGRPTIADIAGYPYIARAPEGGVDLGPYATVRAWLDRMAGLPGFVPMPEF